MYALAALIGLFVIGPALCWVLGMFNPIGWMGVLPWRVPASARAAEREGKLWTPDYHQTWTERHSRTAPDFRLKEAVRWSSGDEHHRGAYRGETGLTGISWVDIPGGPTVQVATSLLRHVGEDE